MTNPPGSAAPERLRLRRPAPAFAILGIALLFGVSAALIVWAVGGFASLNPHAFMGLVWPASIGAGLAAGSIGGRLRRMGAITRRETAVRGAVAFAAAALAWTLSFSLFPLFDGDVQGFLGALDEIILGALIGAGAGAAGALAASYASLTRI
ncbi:MAG: hypothetical protein HXY28_10285 [Hydrogenophilaceae bacterium]|jgi:hypothetical protein|nr:hypothetical protein [Hydrogenophilaceae bacterium]